MAYMVKSAHRPKIFFGWWTVIAGGIIDLWSAGYQVYGISAMFKPIAADLGFNRALTSTASAIGALEGGIESPIIGLICDRYGPRWLVMFGVFLMSLSLVLMYYVNSLWSFLVVWGVMLGTGHNIAASLPFDTAISNWFVKKRGVALSLKNVLTGISGVIVLPLITWLITMVGWRMTCLIGGIVMALIGFPLAWFCVKQHRPEYYGLLPDGAAQEEKRDIGAMLDKGVQYASEVQEVEFSFRETLRTGTYWLLISVQSIQSLVFPIMTVHCIPFLTDMGISPLKAAGMMAVMIGASIPSRFLGGVMADRVRREHLRFLRGSMSFLQALGIALFLYHQSVLIIYTWFILYGFGQGAEKTLSPLMTARYFGRKAYGSIRGTATMLVAPVSIAAPVYAGWIYDTTGNYMTVFVQFAALLAIAAGITAFTLPPKTPAQKENVRQIIEP